MPDNILLALYAGAIADFRHARQQAFLKQMMSRLTGRSVDLLSYEQVRQQLKIGDQKARSRQEIPLDAIIGSVDRYTDFTRDFLPKRNVDETRWARLKVATAGPAGWPPIQVYQVSDVYFVLDGHHRVSVARQIGMTHIEAYVIQVHTTVPLTPDTQPDDLILKAEYADFAKHTCLDRLRPEADLEVTAPGQYEVLKEHIAVHRYFMGLEQGQEIPYDEAVVHWYDTFYLPIAEMIRSRDILRDFPGRTETDLYLWILEHRGALAGELGWTVSPEAAAVDLAARFSHTPQRIVSRVSKQMMETVTPGGFVGGTPTGTWRQERSTGHPEDRLFADILVAIDGNESGWHALEWAAGIAQHEQARLYGLHVVPVEAQVDSEAVQMIRNEFERRCAAAGIPGELAPGMGQVSRLICERARMMDLVVLSPSQLYASQPIARLGSGLHAIIRRSPVPVVAVSGCIAPPDRMLLAYDGSPKATEALFVATYLAGRLDIPLIVLVVTEDEQRTKAALLYAQTYAENHKVQVTAVQERGPVAETILVVAEEMDANLIVMGGYGAGPMIEFALGSTVERVLQSSCWPVLICQ